MSTRSNIGIIAPNGTVEVIYCHNDGYPSYNGKMLLENYKTLAKVRQLIKLGDISSLDMKAGKPPKGHTFDNRIDGYVVAYHRDRGEDLCPARKYKDTKVAKSKCDNDYLYLFDTVTKAWFFRGYEGVLKPLTAADTVDRVGY